MKADITSCCIATPLTTNKTTVGAVYPSYLDVSCFRGRVPRDLTRFRKMDSSTDVRGQTYRKVGVNFYISLSALFYKTEKPKMIKRRLQTR